MSGYVHLIYEQRGPVTVITINRPERMKPAQTYEDYVDSTNVTIPTAARALPPSHPESRAR